MKESSCAPAGTSQQMSQWEATFSHLSLRIEKEGKQEPFVGKNSMNKGNNEQGHRIEENPDVLPPDESRPSDLTFEASPLKRFYLLKESSSALLSLCMTLESNARKFHVAMTTNQTH